MTSRPVWRSADDLAQRRARLEILLGRMRTKRDRNTVWALLVLQREDETAWDAAPADAAEAVRGALLATHVYTSDEIDGQAQTEAHVDADVVLRALGCPDPEPRA